MLGECPVFKTRVLKITGIPSSVSDKDLEEVVCKAITKAGVNINADEI